MVDPNNNKVNTMNTYTREQLNDKTVSELLKMAKQVIHPDKVDADQVEQATELFKTLNTMNKQGLIDLLVLYFNHNLFDKVDVTAEILETLRDLKANGDTRKAGKGWLVYKYDIDGKQATELLDQVWSRSKGADKGAIVAHIIHCQNAGYTNSEIADSLCTEFNWAPSTGKTVVSHLSYMIEYARQTN